MKKYFIPIAYLSLSTLAPADEVTIKTQLEALKTITKEFPVNPSEDSNKNQAIQYARLVTSQLEQQINSRKYQELQTWIQQSVSSHSQLPVHYKKVLTSLKKEIQAHIQELEAAEISEIEKLLIQIKTEILAAQQPEDLDKLLSIVTIRAQKSNNYSSRSNKSLYALQQRLSNSSNIISEWQNYLIAESVQDSKSCKRSLENLSRSLASNPIIPRSHVLRLLNPQSIPTPPPAAEEKNSTEESQYMPFPEIQMALDQGAKLKDIIILLDKLPSAQLENNEVKKFKEAAIFLNSLPFAGSTPTLDTISTAMHNNYSISQVVRSSHFTKARNKALMPILKKNHAVHLQKLDSLPETPELLLESLLSHFLAAKDWTNAAKITDSQASYAKLMNPRSELVYKNKSTALVAIARANAATQANEIQLAIKNYRTAASKTEDPRIFQLSFSGIKALKESHPEEFKAETEYAKASALIEIEERLARANSYRSRRYSNTTSRGHLTREDEISPQLKKHISDSIQAELAKNRLELLDDKLSKENHSATPEDAKD